MKKFTVFSLGLIVVMAIMGITLPQSKASGHTYTVTVKDVPMSWTGDYPIPMAAEPTPLPGNADFFLDNTFEVDEGESISSGLNNIYYNFILAEPACHHGGSSNGRGFAYHYHDIEIHYGLLRSVHLLNNDENVWIVSGHRPGDTPWHAEGWAVDLDCAVTWDGSDFAKNYTDYWNFSDEYSTVPASDKNYSMSASSHMVINPDDFDLDESDYPTGIDITDSRYYEELAERDIPEALNE